MRNFQLQVVHQLILNKMVATSHPIACSVGLEILKVEVML